jgi:hypothetical protein
MGEKPRWEYRFRVDGQRLEISALERKLFIARDGLASAIDGRGQ